MNTLQRIQAIQKHFEETPKEQILYNMKQAGFEIAEDMTINEQLKSEAKKNLYAQSMNYKVTSYNQLWSSTKNAGVGS
ncbi:hypothetical protein [Caryophanon latum]|uniref:Uncharacterized protein n=1 Tax=Caryophanon latum TaxID=33977 RepID=A0A1C0YJJ0_9BACL|nr:hypothetical protein [Caryophanon latum]OCS87304.1 hypothetical protein A6K76_02740 [Caryophanon latum]